MRPRTALSIACFAALVIASIRIPPLTLPFVDREPIRRSMTVLPDAGIWWPDYPRFLEAVRAKTQRGDTIALFVPTFSWEGGYSYAYYRASYFLAGREVLPVIVPGDRRVPQNANRAKYVAIWHGRPPSGVHVVFEGFGGTLVRR